MLPTSSPIDGTQGSMSNDIRTVTLRLRDSPAAPGSSLSGKEIILTAERFQKLKSFLLSIDHVEVDTHEQFNSVFSQCTIDAIYSSYAAAQNRVLHHTEVLRMLQREVDEWAQKVQNAIDLMPEYRPGGWLSGVLPLPGQTNF